MASRGESSRAARRQHRSSRWAATLLTSVVVAASAVVTVSTQTATYSATVRLAGTTIGVGPSFEPFGLSFPLMFYGTIVPEGDSFHTVPYPAQLTISLPIISDLPVLSHLPYWPQSLKRSEAIGAGYLEQDIANMPAGDKITIIGISQGTQVAEIDEAYRLLAPMMGVGAATVLFIAREPQASVVAADRHGASGGGLRRRADGDRHQTVARRHLNLAFAANRAGKGLVLVERRAVVRSGIHCRFVAHVALDQEIDADLGGLDRFGRDGDSRAQLGR